MMRIMNILSITLLAFPLWAGASVPFTLPPGAKVSAPVQKDKGWQTVGELPVSFQQAQTQLSARIAAANWAHVHTITLGRDRVLDAWRRGKEELTVMVWRVETAKSGFSYGITRQDGTKGKERRK